jgi:hypothetical protein
MPCNAFGPVDESRGDAGRTGILGGRAQTAQPYLEIDLANLLQLQMSGNRLAFVEPFLRIKKH